MALVVEERGNNIAYEGDQDYTEDGTVDLKGKPVLRSKTGRWKACSFIVAFQAILANLVLYLTMELHQGTVTASNTVTNWNGFIWMTPILGAYIADAYLGRFWTAVLGSAMYLAVIVGLNHLFASGMLLLTLAVSLPALKPPSCTTNHGIKEENCSKVWSLKVGIFFLALYTIAVGSGGTQPHIPTMGVQQFDDFEPKERIQKLSVFNWVGFGVFFGCLIAETLLVYIQDNVGWNLGYGLPTAGLVVAVMVFLMGTPFYRHELPLGSPFTRIAKVFVSALRKWKVPLPDPNELYELSQEDCTKNGIQRIDHTLLLRFLDKAAVRCGTNKRWALCSVTQVEETNKIVKLLPVFVATFNPAITLAQIHTLFIKQGATLDRSMGSPHFNISPACLAVFVTIFMLVSIVIYDRFFVPAVWQYTNNPRGITMLQRIGIGIFLHIIVSITSCFTERKRLGIARANGIVREHETVPLTVFVLLPQFALMGIANAFLEIGKQEFFSDQAPQGMKSLAATFTTTSRGVGNFLSSFLLTSVSEITKRHGQKGWILNNLNESRLDYYYAFLAALAFLNLLFFLIVAKFFVYNAEAKKSQMYLDGSGTIYKTKLARK